MAVLMVQDIPGGTQEQYEQVTGRLHEGGLRSPSDWPVEGLLAHAARPTDTGWRVVDVWESEEAFQRFGEVLLPLLEELGVPGEPPQVSRVHNLVK